MMKETVADADSPYYCVESGAAELAGVPSSKPIPAGAGGGARSHRSVGGAPDAPLINVNLLDALH
jgi:hypothetical protein